MYMKTETETKVEDVRQVLRQCIESIVSDYVEIVPADLQEIVLGAERIRVAIGGHQNQR